MKYSLIISTVPDETTGRKIAGKLLKAKLCACVNILPGAKSFYWWKGKIDSSRECVLLIKTTQTKRNALTKILKKIHPYEIPEIISLEIKDGWKPYLDWISASLK